jgi:uncharacterized protein (TIGR03118 family)
LAVLVSVAALAAGASGPDALGQMYPDYEPKLQEGQFNVPGAGPRKSHRNAYVQVNLVATKAEYKPHFFVDERLANAWGVTTRPPGKGGHWWITNAGSGTTTTYIGDAPGVEFGRDELEVVEIPVGKVHASAEPNSQPTGQVYTGFTSEEFVVEGEGKKGSSRFVFVALDGTISGWTTGQTKSVNVVDDGGQGAVFTGCAVTQQATGNKLYVCDWSKRKVRVFDGQWREIKVAGDFRDPKVDQDFEIYNLHYINGKLYAAWARLGNDPGEAEAYPGYGYISEFDLAGRLLRSFEHSEQLNAPWGFELAPKDFGALSGCLLVGNFGDGRIIAYDMATAKIVDVMRDPEGKPFEIDGLWGLLFGNGETLGYKNHLYFAAGPKVETEGVFGKLVPLFP